MDNDILSRNVAKAYLDFEVFRTEFIKKWCAVSSFNEERKSGNIRPVVLLRTKAMIDELRSDIEIDRRLLAVLGSEPERFSPKASKFRPIAEPIKGVTKVSISQPPATNSRKKTKAELLRTLGRLVDRLEHTVLTTGTDHSIKALALATKEFEAINDNEEEIYRVRTYGYTDTCVYLAQNGATKDKVRIPLTGIFVLDTQSACVVSTSERKDPKLAIKSYPVTPISCSAILKGLLYRQGDIDKHCAEVKMGLEAKEAAKAEKLAVKEAAEAEELATKEAVKAEKLAVKEATKAEKLAVKDAAKAEKLAVKDAAKAKELAAKEVAKAEKLAVKEAAKEAAKAEKLAVKKLKGNKSRRTTKARNKKK